MGLKITNYLKNLGKSVKYAATEDFKTKYENVYETVAAPSGVARDTVKAIVNYKQTIRRAQDYLRKSTIYDVSNTALKNAKADLKSGKFYNMDRVNKSFGIDEDFDWNFDGDDDFESSGSESSNMTFGEKAITSSIDASSRVSATQISNSVFDAAKYQAEVSKQNTSFMFVQQERLFGNLNNSITSLHGTLGDMQNFLTGPLHAHINNSTKFYEESTKYQRENNAILKELLDMERIRFKEEDEDRKANKRRLDRGLRTDITDIVSSGVMDWSSYFKQVGKNIMNQGDELGLGMISKEMMMSFATNPLQMIPSMLVSQMMGKPLERAITSFNKTLGSVFNQVNADLKKSGKESDSPFASLLANIFGVDIASKSKIDTSAYNKGRVPFDGITRKAIIETIPGHLARIEALLGGEERSYDYQAGKFVSRKEINKIHEDTNKTYRNIGTSDYKHKLNNNVDSMAKALGLSRSEIKRIKEDIVERAVQYAWENDGSMDGFSESFFGNDAKFARALVKRTDKRGLASDVAYSKRREAEEYDKLSKDGSSILLQQFNGSKESLVRNNSANMQTAFGKNGVFQNMLTELYLIRTGGIRNKGKQISKGQLPDYIDFNSVRDVTVVKEKKQVAQAVADSKKESGRTLDDFDESALDNLATTSSPNGKFDSVTGAKGLKGKAKAFKANWSDIWRNPRLFLAESVAAVDRSVYSFFFDHDNGEKDSEGRPITGFYDKMAFELKNTFTQFRDWMKTNVYEPMKALGRNAWGKVKDFGSNYAGEWLKSGKRAFMSAGGSTLSRIINSFADGSLAVPETGLTTISKGELIIPADQNPFNPDRLSANRSKARADERSFKAKLFNSIMSHADGGNSLDDIAAAYRRTTNAANRSKVGNAVYNTLPPKVQKFLDSDDKTGVVAGLLNYAISSLGGKVDGINSKELAETAKGATSQAFNTGLDKLKEYSKGLNPDTAKSLNNDIEKLRKDSSGIAGRTAFGGATGLITGGMLFGPTGILAGAALGSAANLIRESDTAKNFLFGKELEDGSRAGGLITRKQQALVKKYYPSLMKGTVASFLPSLLLGFGPVGALAMGGAFSIAQNNRWANEKIFGRKYYDKDGKEIGRRGGLFGPKVQAYIKKSMPKIGGFSAATVLLDPTGMGLVGNLALGAGLGMLSSSETFQNLILGEKGEDGKRKGGVAGAIKSGVIHPLKSFGRTLKDDFFGFMNENLFSPLKMSAKIFGQSLINSGRSMKYTISNTLERILGGPFSMMLGKRFADYILKPFGNKIAGFTNFVGGIGKFVGGGFIRGIGGGINKLNNRANRSMIMQGRAGHLSAAQRLEIMGDENYAFRDRDEMLKNASFKDLSQLEESLSVFQSQFSIGGGDTRKAVKGLENAIKDKLSVSQVRQITKFAVANDTRGAMSYIEGLDYDSSTKTKLVQAFNKELPRIQSALGKKKYTSKELAKAKSHLAKYNIDPTDRHSLGFALSQVKGERDRAEVAEMLTKGNAAKFSSQEAAATAEGLTKTNDILIQIRDNLIKANGGEIPKDEKAKTIIKGFKGKSNSQRWTDSNGVTHYRATDGSDNEEDNESRSDRKRDESNKDKKQEGFFSKIFSKLGIGKKDDKKDGDRSSKGLLGKVTDGLFSNIGTIASMGAGLAILGPMLPAISKAVGDLLPSIGKMMTDTVLPALGDLIWGGLKSGASSIIDYIMGNKTVVDENGNRTTVDDPEASGNLLTRAGTGLAAGYIATKLIPGGSLIRGGVKLAGKGIGKGVKTVWNAINGSEKVAAGAKAAGSYLKGARGKKVADAAKNAEKTLSKTKMLEKASSNNKGIIESISKKMKSGFDSLKSVHEASLKSLSGAAHGASEKMGKGFQFLKKLVAGGLESIAEHVPILKGKSAGTMAKVAESILNGIKRSPKALAKIGAKVAAAAGLTAATAGLGAIAIAVWTGVDLAASVANGRTRWYNIAGVLADEEVDDDVKWLAALCNGIDSLLFDVLGGQFYFDLLCGLFDIDLSQQKARAISEIDKYNQSQDKPSGAPSSVSSVEEYNEKVLGKSFGQSVKDFFFGKSGKGKNADPTKKDGNNDSKNGPTLWDSAKNKISSMMNSAKNFVSNNYEWAKNTASNAINNAEDYLGTSEIGGRIYKAVKGKDYQPNNPNYGKGKYFKQTDPKYAGVKFNQYGDSITQTIGDSGCGPVAGANALRALGAGSINPVEASQFALNNGFKGKDTGVAPSFFNSYAASHGATSYQTDAAGTIRSLMNGNPVVLQGESTTGATSSTHPFGGYPHYVTATGYDPRSGKVTIQDPESNSNNTKYNLMSVLKNTISANAFGRGKGPRFGRGNNAQQIWTWLINKGFSTQAASAIMGSMQQESSFNPEASQGGGGIQASIAGGEGGNGYGLCQWTGSRTQALLDFAGDRANTIEGQLEFMVSEMSARGTLDAFKNASTLDQALAVMKDYEGYGEVGSREEYARAIFQSNGNNLASIMTTQGGNGGAKPSIFGSLFKQFDNIRNSYGGMIDNMIMGNPFMKNAMSMLGLDGGNSGSSGGPVGNGDLSKASKWAQSMVGQEGFGNNGCTTFVNKYLEQAGENQINYYVPTAESDAHNNTPYAFKPANMGGKQGDVVLLNTLTSDPEADHVVIADGQGGYWGNSSSKNLIVHGNIANDFGADNINGYIATGGDGNGNVPSGAAKRSQKEILGDSSLDYGMGKHAIYGRAKGVPQEVQAVIEGNTKAIDFNKNAAKAQVKYGRGTESDNSLEIQYLAVIYEELTKITGNTSGINGMVASQAQTEQKVNSVQTGLQESIAGIGNYLNKKIEDVSDNVHGQLNKVTKHVSGSTINKLQYLASK